MKHKKTFWRGFGAGVLFAAVILGISCLIRTSDAQVVARAKKLGMVYETSDTVSYTHLLGNGEIALILEVNALV